MKYVTTIGAKQFVIDINRNGQIIVNNEVINIDMRQMKDTTMYSIITDGTSHDLRIHEGEGVYEVELSG
jgi:hypothetical protein